MSIESTIMKAQRLAEDKGIVVPGFHCRDCLDHSCPHNWQKQEARRELISMGDNEFQQDLTTLLQHLPYVAEMTALALLGESMKS
jgi:hypothetical protein